MRFWVELKDHVPNGQTVTSLLRFNTSYTKQTYNESMSGGKGLAAVTDFETCCFLTTVSVFPCFSKGGRALIADSDLFYLRARSQHPSLFTLQY